MPNVTSHSVLKIAVLNPLYTLFDYLPPDNTPLEAIPLGARVQIPFGRRTQIGFVIAYGSTTFNQDQLKSILHLIDQSPLFPPNTWNLLLKAHQYYHHSLGEVIQTGLPLALRKGKPLLSEQEYSKILTPPVFNAPAIPTLNPEQHHAVEQLQKTHNTFHCFLLEGITGSGKTEVYLQAIQTIRDNQKSVLILIPEIALSPQTLERFQMRFNEPIALYHSQMTDKQRLLSWCAIKDGKIKIIIGTRSALFLPIQDLGLIIIDEEHDASFKQQEGFRYSARDMAVLLAQQQHIPIILGSATPSFESLHNANQKKYTPLFLPNRAGNAQLPELTIIDIRHKKLEGGLSNQLISNMEKHLEEKGQVLVFLNQRGYATAWMCFDCGWFAQCKRCDTRLTYHRGMQRLRCHHCEAQLPIPKVCQACASPNIRALGTGTEKIEETLQILFPNKTQVRIDKDTTARKGTLQSKLTQITTGDAQILIGTQLLAKGHHFPNVTLVAIVDVDGGLFSTDFRAVERMGQLITQVAGRAGRGARKGSVILQTCHPENGLIQSMAQQNYQAFSNTLLVQRKECALPPFSHFALLRASATNASLPEEFFNELKQALKKIALPTISVLGPVPAPMPKRQNNFRFQLLLQSQDRASLHQLLKQLRVITLDNNYPRLHTLAKRLRWSIDVDPIEMG